MCLSFKLLEILMVLSFKLLSGFNAFNCFSYLASFVSIVCCIFLCCFIAIILPRLSNMFSLRKSCFKLSFQV